VSRPRPAPGLLAGAVLLALLGVAASGSASRPRWDADASWSPLYERRLEIGVQQMDRAGEPALRASLQLYHQPEEMVLSLNPISFCAGSACLGSFCGGSACLLSKCAGSACANSTCVGSGCAVSACLGSSCGGSLCLGSGCLGSGCVGSACLTCGAEDGTQACRRG
jgi:hypothetical protein